MGTIPSTEYSKYYKYWICTCNLIIIRYFGSCIHRYTTAKIVKNISNIVINRASKQRKCNQYNEIDSGVLKHASHNIFPLLNTFQYIVHGVSFTLVRKKRHWTRKMRRIVESELDVNGRACNRAGRIKHGKRVGRRRYRKRGLRHMLQGSKSRAGMNG